MAEVNSFPNHSAQCAHLFIYACVMLPVSAQFSRFQMEKNKTTWVSKDNPQLQPQLYPHTDPYLCFSLVVEGEDVVSPACLTLSDQKHPVSLWPGALNQVGRLDARDGSVEPGVGEQEVICLLDYLLWQGEGDRSCRDDQRRRMCLFLSECAKLAEIINTV